MEVDLKLGIKGGTKYIKSAEGKDKKEIDKKLKKITEKYDLKKLTLIIDKHDDNGKEQIHVHGEVNREGDGEKLMIDFKEHKNLTQDEENRLKLLSGGTELLIQIDKLKGRDDEASKRDLKGYLGEARTTFGMLDDNKENLFKSAQNCFPRHLLKKLEQKLIS